MSEKRCSKCGQTKPVERFSWDRGTRKSECKTCDAAYRRAHRAERYEYCKRWKAENPGAVLRRYDPKKHKARHDLERALKNGAMKREPCVECGDARSEAHHEDYTKPLAVTWLCKTHHAERHQVSRGAGKSE